jgi:DeoR family transcriptional regulator of aga operon
MVLMDKLFLGVCGVDPVHGATVIEADEAAVFRAMARRARQVIVVADSSKVAMTSPAVVCQPQTISTLVTDDGVSEQATEAFRRIGVQVIVV